MKIYELDFDVSNYVWLKTSKENMRKFCQLFDGKNLKDSWVIPKAERIDPEEGRPLGDAPEFVLPTFSKRALDALLPLMEGDIEVLPVEFEDSYLYGINVTTVLDNVIDYDLSEYKTFSDGTIMHFKKYVFKNDAVGEKNIFKISDEDLGSPFVSQEFYDAVRDNGLEGFKLKLVYDDEEKEPTKQFDSKKIEPTKQINSEKKEKGSKNFFEYIGELPQDIKSEVERMIIETPKIFNINGKDGKEIATEINDIVDNILETHTFPKEYSNIDYVAVALGIFWGNAVCNYYNWSWKMLGDTAQTSLVSIVSPEENYSIQPMNYMQRILTNKNIGLGGLNDNTVLLLFNMLKNIDDNPENEKYFPIS